jgi:streptogramin lyase
VTDTLTTDAVGVESDKLPATAGKTYLATSAVYIQSGAAYLEMHFYNASGAAVGTIAWAQVKGAIGTWLTGTLEAIAPAGATQVAVRVYSSMSDVAVDYFDDVTLKEIGGTPTEIGQMISNVAGNRTVFATTPAGREVIYVGLNGAKVAQIDARTGALLAQVDLPAADSYTVWGLVVAPNGTVYIGTQSTTGTSAPLYRWTPGSAAVSLGKPVVGDNVIWDLAIDTSGNVYGGTYPSGKVFQYSPATGQIRNYGQIEPNSQFVRSLAWCDGKLYIGLGYTKARLFTLDPVSGVKQEIKIPATFPTAYNAQVIYDLDSYSGYILLRTSNYSDLLLYRPSDGGWKDLGASYGAAVSPPGPSNEVYWVTTAGKLTSYNLNNGLTGTPTTISTPGFTDLWAEQGFGWAHLGTTDYPGATLVFTNWYGGQLRQYNPTTKKHGVIQAMTPKTVASLRSTAIGPDGRVYVSGYQSGGLAVYDPNTNATSQYPVPTNVTLQAEDMYTAFNRLWLGVYPGANIMSFDPKQPFNYGANPTTPFSLSSQDQDRPYAIEAVGDQLAIGTVPGYGKLNGALTLYRPSTGERTTYQNVVQNQSVISLAAIGNTVYGGTSVYGGEGAAPTASNAVVFAWDTTTNKKLWEVTPIAGERAVTALVAAPNGKLWGITVGKLFELEPKTGAVLRTTKLYDYTFSNTVIVYDSAELAVGADGMVRAQTGDGKLMLINPMTLTTTTLATGVSKPSFAANGDVYYLRGGSLMVYRPIN